MFQETQVCVRFSCETSCDASCDNCCVQAGYLSDAIASGAPLISMAPRHLPRQTSFALPVHGQQSCSTCSRVAHHRAAPLAKRFRFITTASRFAFYTVSFLTMAQPHCGELTLDPILHLTARSDAAGRYDQIFSPDGGHHAVARLHQRADAPR